MTHSVGAQSTLTGGWGNKQDIFAEIVYENLTKIPNFTHFPEKFMPEFYIVCPKNIFPGFFWGGGEATPLPPVSNACGWAQAPHQLNPAL